MIRSCVFGTTRGCPDPNMIHLAPVKDHKILMDNVNEWYVHPPDSPSQKDFPAMAKQPSEKIAEIQAC